MAYRGIPEFLDQGLLYVGACWVENYIESEKNQQESPQQKTTLKPKSSRRCLLYYAFLRSWRCTSHIP